VDHDKASCKKEEMAEIALLFAIEDPVFLGVANDAISCKPALAGRKAICLGCQRPQFGVFVGVNVDNHPTLQF
jgi:hypothetical protein